MGVLEKKELKIIKALSTRNPNIKKFITHNHLALFILFELLLLNK